MEKINIMTKKYLTVIFGLFLVWNSSAVFSQEAKNILKKMDEVMFFAKDKKADVKLTIENLKNGKVTVKKAQTFEKNGKTLFRYTYPKADSGITSLTASENETYLYLPLFNMVKKITNTSSMGNMNKSDFALADKPRVSYSNSYQPELINTTEKAYVLKLTPKFEKNPYSRLVIYVDKKNNYPDIIEYYDKNGKKLKTAKYHYAKIQGHEVADMIVMTNEQKQSRTTIEFSNIKINQGLPDAMFTKENLKKKKNK